MSYADSCTLPNLTPSCPFYKDSDGEPTCSEQCRSIIEERGGGARKVIQTNLGGLVLQGRELPTTVVAGRSGFDATQLYLEQRELPEDQQGTTSLLLSLRSILIEHIISGVSASLDRATDIWGILSRRLGNMDAILISGLSRSMAGAVSARVLLELLDREGTSNLSLNALPRAQERTWLLAAEAAFEKRSPQQGRRHIREGRILESVAVFSGLFSSTTVSEQLSELPIFDYIHSREFRHLVECWFERLVDHDLAATLSGVAPQASLFAALSGYPSKNEHAVWIWERFTNTEVEDWSHSSYVLEWAWAQDRDSGGCDPRALAERDVPQELLSKLAMEQASEIARSRKPEHRGFRHEAFSNKASEFLINGKWEDACRIFEGLVELLPGDPVAWNNLGFCQLADNPEVALQSLKRASLLSEKPSMLREANQVLALHLLGRDEEAVDLARKCLILQGEISSHEIFLWAHPVPDTENELELTTRSSLVDYVQELHDHIASGGCTSIHVSQD